MSVKRTQRIRRTTNRDVQRTDKKLLNYPTTEELEAARRVEAEPTSPKVWDALIARKINEAT